MDEQPLLLNTIQDLLDKFVNYLPSLIAGLVVLALGALVAWVVSRLVVRLIIFLRIDRVIVRLGWARALEKGDVRHSLFGFVGSVIAALIFLVFLENAIVIWQLTVLSQLLERLVLLIPRLIAAALILLIGWGIAVAVARAVRRALYQEEFERARLVGRIVFSGLIVLTVALALVQLDVAVSLVTGACLITFGALALSFVLAVGLGSRRAVERLWEERLRKNEPPDDARSGAPKSSAASGQH